MSRATVRALLSARAAGRGRRRRADVPPVSPSERSGLFTDLDAGGSFVRDSAVGAMFHRGQTSFREASRRGSLHISVGEGGRVSAHVDRYSPLSERKRTGRHRYSVIGVIVHNVGVVADYARLAVTGRFGHQRCVLDCEKVEMEGEAAAGQPLVLDLGHDHDHEHEHGHHDHDHG